MPPYGSPRPGNLYRLPPRLVGTACTLYSLLNDVFESCEFRGRRSGTGAEFPPCSLTFFLLISIPPLLYTYLSPYDSLDQVALFFASSVLSRRLHLSDRHVADYRGRKSGLTSKNKYWFWRNLESFAAKIYILCVPMTFTFQNNLHINTLLMSFHVCLLKKQVFGKLGLRYSAIKI